MNEIEEKNNDIVVLFFNNPNADNVFLEYFNKMAGLKVECVFKPVGKLFRVFRKLHFKSNLPGVGMWLMPWKKQVRIHTKYICIASQYSPAVLKWIKKKNPGVKCINYFWDSIEISGYPLVKDRNFENWTFCEEDSIKYQIKYNPQFYLHNMKLEKKEAMYDVSYIGADRNGTLRERTQLVNYYYNFLICLGCSTFFYYVSKDNFVDRSIGHRTLLAENKYYDICSKSKVIIELVEPEIKWVTLRTLLALSNGKKLITNNSNVKKERYYSSDNVFIIGEDREDKLVEFINEPFIPITDKNLLYYDAEAWSKRFFDK